jgi:hypothetical protein
MNKRKKKSGISPQIWTAIITTIGVIIVALLAFPPVQELFKSKPSPTITSTLQPDTPTPSPTFTETHTPTSSPTETLEPIQPFTAFTPTSGSPIGMQVKITANTTNGRAPLDVTLNAKDSFVRAPDGTIFECKKGGCSYIWYVYLNGEQFIDPQKTSGTLGLKLDKRGNYFVSVYICHGADAPTCASGGTVVIVE